MSAGRRSTRVLRRCVVAAALLGVVSCGDELQIVNVVGDTTKPTLQQRRAVAVAELTFTHLNSSNISASLLVAATVVDLERLRGTAGAVSDVAVLRFDAIVNGTLRHAPRDGASATRVIRATFGVTNARRDSILFDRLRENVAFVAIATNATVAGTPIRRFEREDRSAAATALARQVAPTGLMAVNGDGELVTIDDSPLQRLTDAQSRNTASPTGVSSLFPYGFVVKAVPVGAVGPEARFDGALTLSFRLPVEPRDADNPTTLSVLFLIVDDPNQR